MRSPKRCSLRDEPATKPNVLNGRLAFEVDTFLTHQAARQGTHFMKAYSLRQLFPRDAVNYYGPRSVVVVLALINVIGTVRSLIHIFASDSGAQSIAGMDVNVTGGENIIALLAQWGGAQLLEALIIWVVIVRYRGLVPFMMLIVTLEQVVRQLIGNAKPVISEHTPPGTLSTSVFLPICILGLVAALYVRREFRDNGRDNKVGASLSIE